MVPHQKQLKIMLLNTFFDEDINNDGDNHTADISRGDISRFTKNYDMH